VTIDSYVLPWGRRVTVILRDRQGNELRRVRGTKLGTGPRTLGEGVQFPVYEVVVVDGVPEVLEHRRSGPVLYVVDDPDVKRKLGVR
jgi:hypothetical protein